MFYNARCLPLVVRSGNYFLFETDSEEEEKQDEPTPDRSAVQVNYPIHSVVSDAGQ